MGLALATTQVARRRRGRSVQSRWDRAVESGNPIDMLDVARDEAAAVSAQAIRANNDKGMRVTERLAHEIHALTETARRHA